MRKNGKPQMRNLLLGFMFFFVWSYLYPLQNESTSVASHKIFIEIFPKKHTFKSTDELHVRHSSPSISLNLNKGFKINFVKVNGKKKSFQFNETPDMGEPKKILDDNFAGSTNRAARLILDAESAGEHTVLLSYEGLIYEEPTASQFSREYVANQTAGIISEQGIFLSPESFWYPQGDEQMSRFDVITTTPTGYETVTQGKRLRREMKVGKLITHWKNIYPSDVLFLQAGPYTIQEDEIGSIKVYTYFFKGDEELASLYLKKSKDYLDLYNRLLGPYPYEKFAVVENFFETGYGMPSWTLLGRTVVRLPFIPDTSLPHEICHNWWGNGVFVDYSAGNWCEGLTVYCADYLLKNKMEIEGGNEYRRQINRDYASYIRENNDFPLIEFHSRHNPATRAVGYGKTMMVFHTLQRLVGEERFFEGLRHLMAAYRFKRAAWKDVLGVYEKECGIDLRHFYKIWVERAGAPLLRLEDVWSQRRNGEFAVTFTLIQDGNTYDLDVPVVVTTEKGDVKQNFKIGNSVGTCEILTQAKPLRLEVDPDNHLFRRLYPEEIPPSIAKVFGSESQLIIVGTGEDNTRFEEYMAAAQMINRTKTAVIKIDAEVTAEELNTKTVILLGCASEKSVVLNFLSGLQQDLPWDKDVAESDDSGVVVVYRNPEAKEHSIMSIKGGPQSDLRAIVRKLPHYGKYSYLVFRGEKNVVKSVWKIEMGPLIYVFE